MAPKTLEQLVDLTDADIAWRRQELANLKISASGTAVEAQTASRACVALAYAHWEGYVITASRALVDFVRVKKLRYRELSDSYVAMCFAPQLSKGDEATRRIERHIDIVAAIRDDSERASFPGSDVLIHSRGNLKSSRLEDILRRLTIDDSDFATHYNWIDHELLRRRNHVAHGRSGFADKEFAMDAIETVDALMLKFRTAIQNAASLETYKR